MTLDGGQGFHFYGLAHLAFQERHLRRSRCRRQQERFGGKMVPCCPLFYISAAGLRQENVQGSTGLFSTSLLMSYSPSAVKSGLLPPSLCCQDNRTTWLCPRPSICLHSSASLFLVCPFLCRLLTGLCAAAREPALAAAVGSADHGRAASDW